MKRAFVILLLVVCLTILAWGCDFGAVPMTVLVTPTSTPTVTPSPTATITATPSNTPAPTNTATYTPTNIPTATNTSLPSTNTATPTEEPTSTIQLTDTPTEDAQPTPIEDATEAPAPTKSTPKATATSEDVAEDTPTAVKPKAPTPTTEPAPAGGWSEVTRGYPGKKRVALTFDAGGTGETMPAVLNVLRERGIHITMFFTGKFVEEYPDSVRQAVADGNEIANHTYSHTDSLLLTDQELKDELARTESIIYNTTGVSTKPYWRPPYGSRDNHVLNVAKSQGYRSIYWTLDSLDSVGAPKTPDFIFNRVTNTPNFNLDGAIILQHFGSDASAEALPRILDRLQEMGYSVVTISDLLTP